MKANKRLFLAILGFCVVLIGYYIAIAGEPVRSSNENTPALTYVYNQRDILKGLAGVHVIVEDMRPEADKVGLTQLAIKTDVELELRRFGVRVLSENERMAIPGSPSLYVNVNADSLFENKLWGDINIALKEKILLLRQPIVCIANTWTSSAVFKGHTEQQVRDRVKQHVDEFINDYLAANPKETVGPKDTNDSLNH